MKKIENSRAMMFFLVMLHFLCCLLISGPCFAATAQSKQAAQSTHMLSESQKQAQQKNEPEKEKSSAAKTTADAVAEDKKEEVKAEQQKIESEKEKPSETKKLEEQKPSSFPPVPIKMVKDKKIVYVTTSTKQLTADTLIGKQILSVMELYVKKMENNKDIGIKLQQEKTGIIRTIKKMIKPDKPKRPESPFMLGLFGTEKALSLMPLIKEQQAMLLFPTEGSAVIRTLPYDNIIYYGPSHEKELRLLVDYAVNILFKHEIAIFYEASIWGESVLKTLEQILNEYKLKPLAIGSYPEGTVSVSSAIYKITQQSPNIVFCLANSRPTYHFISNGMNQGLHKCIFMGLSRLNEIQKLLFASRGIEIISTSLVPHPVESDLEIAKEFRNDMKKFLPLETLSVFAFQTYVYMAIFEQCLRMIEGDITVEKLLAVVQSFKNYAFKGLTLNFNKDEHTLSSDVWINPGVQQEWILKSREAT